MNIKTSSTKLLGKQQMIIQAVRNSDIKKTNSLIIRKQINLINIEDNKSSTLLHLSCRNSNSDILQIILKQIQKQIQNKTTQINLKQYLNKKNSQGFTALHYAVFKGKIQIVQYLQSKGADIYIINNLGLTVMHIAAQADSPLLLYYFLKKGFNLHIKDSKGSTPLHWACYSGKELASNFLIAWGSAIDAQDQIYGFSPLHLAVLSGNGRIVKKLLLRGANRTLKDYRGKTALDLAIQNEYKNIEKMIVKLINQEDSLGIQQFLNIKQRFRPASRFSPALILFLFLMLSQMILNLVFVLKKISPMFVIFLIQTIVSIITFIMASIKDPGKLQLKKYIDLLQLLKKVDANKICPDCQIIKPPRSRHCQICKVCIMVYDHHCPWINNCIGAKNYCIFYTFLLSFYILIIYNFFLEIACIIFQQEIVTNQKQNKLGGAKIFTISYTIVICIVFFIPMTLLIYIQTKNCLTNSTTYERFSKKDIKQNNELHKTNDLDDNLLFKKLNNNNKQTELNSKNNFQNNFFNNLKKMCCLNSQNYEYQMISFS